MADNNASFDAFDASARGGWGGNEPNYGDLDAGPKTDDKTALPVSVKELVEKASQMTAGSDEHITVGKQAFSTVRFAGRVKFARSEQGGMCMTYGLVDLRDKDGLRSEQVFPVVRYDDTGGSGAGQVEIRPGGLVFVAGKLRFYDNQYSVTSFHVRPIDDKEAALHDMWAKVAKVFYVKGVLDLDEQGKKRYKGTIFSDEPPQPRDQQRRDQAGGNQPYPRAPFQQLAPRQHPQQMAHAAQRQATPAANGNQQDGEVGSEQRMKILDYIRENGEGGGVSKEQVRQALHPDANFERDIQNLLGEALIFNTTGDDVYSSI